MHGRRGSNPRPLVLETSALPAELRPSGAPRTPEALRVSDGDRTRALPDHNRARYRCATLTKTATSWPFVPAPGVEPGRPKAPRFELGASAIPPDGLGAGDGIRTHDDPLRRRPLCPLSYSGSVPPPRFELGFRRLKVGSRRPLDHRGEGIRRVCGRFVTVSSAHAFRWALSSPSRNRTSPPGTKTRCPADRRTGIKRREEESNPCRLRDLPCSKRFPEPSGSLSKVRPPGVEPGSAAPEAAVVSDGPQAL